MHNFLFRATIAIVLFYVEIYEPVKPGKRKTSARFDDSHGSVTNFGIN